MDEFLWSAEYQQNPKSALSRAFDYDSLQQYDEIGRGFEYSRKAVLDPARKGKNYVAMPVFYEKDGKHYLVDFLYKKKTMKELYEEIVNMIIKHPELSGLFMMLMPKLSRSRRNFMAKIRTAAVSG